MNDLPERIWCDFDEETMDRGFFSDEHFAGDVEYLRADLSPVIGYSREQMEDALRHFIGPFRSIDIEYYMNSLTPTAVPVPTVEELAEVMYQNNTALLTNVQARYIAKVVHALLTKGRGGA
jgi:hypothetical protein